MALPLGTYFLGDPSYVLPANIYEDWIESLTAAEDGSGYYTIGPWYFVVGKTAYGDGLYSAQGSDNTYGVDSGMIALVPLPLFSADLALNFGSLHTFTSPVQFTELHGVFTVTSGSLNIVIDTRG
jgi:hypothetical protein